MLCLSLVALTHTVSVSPVKEWGSANSGQMHSSGRFPETKIIPILPGPGMVPMCSGRKSWKADQGPGNLKARFQSIHSFAPVGHRELQKVLQLGFKGRPDSLIS